MTWTKKKTWKKNHEAQFSGIQMSNDEIKKTIITKENSLQTELAY